MDEEGLFHKKYEAAKVFAKAKADRIYLTEFRKSKKAILMAEVAARKPESKVNQQERDAYAHPEYLQLLEGLKVAVENEELARNKLEIISMKFDEWRSKEATAREEMKLR